MFPFVRSLVFYISYSRKSLGVVMIALMVMPLWVPPSWARETPAPVIDAVGAGAVSGSSLDARLSRVERLLENEALVDLMTRMDSLQVEVQQLLGQMEEQSHEMQELKKRQRDLYLDIDQRIRQLEEARAAAPAPTMGAFVPTPVSPSMSASPSSAPSSVAPTMTSTGAMAAPSSATSGSGVDSVDVLDTQEERLAYERAFNLLKDGRYDLAVAAFRSFVKSYPAGNYADNAQYWLGEANYVQRNFKEALAEFGKVVKNFPGSPKRADAMLKMGYTYQELGEVDQALLSLNNVVMNYPNTTAASLAQKRLQSLKRLQ